IWRSRWGWGRRRGDAGQTRQVSLGLVRDRAAMLSDRAVGSGPASDPTSRVTELRYAALGRVLSAMRNLSSCAFESEVLMTRGLNGSIWGSNLSGVECLISRNRAEDPLGMVLPRSLMNWSSMP